MEYFISGTRIVPVHDRAGWISNSTQSARGYRMNQLERQNSNPVLSDEARDTIRQVANLLNKKLSHDLRFNPDGNSFFTNSKTEKENGISAILGTLTEDNIIIIKLALVRTDRTLRIDAGKLFAHLSNLGERVRVCMPVAEEADKTTLWAEIKIRAAPMSIARENVFLDELDRLEKMARLLQLEIPVAEEHAALETKYKDIRDRIEPVLPLRSDLILQNKGLLSWAEEIQDVLSSGTSVAVESGCTVTLDFMLAVMAAVAAKRGETYGKFIQATLDIKKLVDLTKASPGIVIIPAVCISMNTGVYDVANETRVMLNSLAAFLKPVVFIGKQAELQAVFSGGQGGGNDPLAPVVRHAPEIPVEKLVHYSIVSAGKQIGGISRSSEEELADQVSVSLSDLDPVEQKRLLQITARKTVSDWARGNKTDQNGCKKFIARIGEQSETFGGLSPRPRALRSPLVQERFNELAGDPAFNAYFKKHLLAQDLAVDELCNRLVSEVLTRPPHQPIRFCAEGTPATGKSEFCVLLARRLAVPYVNIDAASMPDYHMAVTQLLGSGRGFVGSQQAGRLEQIAKHHAGAVVEVSDLDHAPADVRAGLPDLFLQTLETGEAQAASGAMFSCSNLIFGFTMNLPGGMDEAVQKGIGFQKRPSRRAIQKDVIAEMKRLLSGAFLSRIGTPILFQPLDGNALASILEKAMRQAVLSAAGRFRIHIKEIKLEDNLGNRVKRSIDVNIISFGARALLEQGRSMAAGAFVELRRQVSNLDGKTLVLLLNKENQAVLKVE